MSALSRPARLSVIAAIIRKDWRLVAPLAIIVAALQLIVPVLLHEVTEFPGMPSQVADPILSRNNPLYWIGAFFPALLAAVLTFQIVQADTLTDRRRDWMTRPIGALEIAVAKIALVLGVVFVPFAAGNLIYMLIHGADPAVTLLPLPVMLRNCLFGIALAWLTASLLQAVLGGAGLMILSGIVGAIVLAILTAVAVHTGHNGVEATSDAQFVWTWKRLIFQLGVQVVMIGPILWLLLARRRIQTARLVLVVALLVSGAFPYQPPGASSAQTRGAIAD